MHVWFWGPIKPSLCGKHRELSHKVTPWSWESATIHPQQFHPGIHHDSSIFTTYCMLTFSLLHGFPVQISSETEFLLVDNRSESHWEAWNYFVWLCRAQSRKFSTQEGVHTMAVQSCSSCSRLHVLMLHDAWPFRVVVTMKVYDLRVIVEHSSSAFARQVSKSIRCWILFAACTGVVAGASWSLSILRHSFTAAPPWLLI